MKFTKKQRLAIGGVLYIVFFLVLALFIKLDLGFGSYFTLFYALALIGIIVFQEDLKLIFWFIVVVTAFLLLVAFLILWLFQVPILASIPLFKDGISNEFIIAFFTIGLMISGIISLIVSNRSLVLSRLTILNAYIDNELFLKIKNIGSYSATRIKVNVDLRKKNDLPRVNKRRGWIKFWNDLKLSFWVSEEADIQYLEPNESSDAIDILPLIKKHFKSVKENKDKTYDERAISSTKEVKFRIIMTIYYFNDAGDRAPIPTRRSFRIRIDKQGVHFDK